MNIRMIELSFELSERSEWSKEYLKDYLRLLDSCFACFVPGGIWIFLSPSAASVSFPRRVRAFMLPLIFGRRVPFTQSHDQLAFWPWVSSASFVSSGSTRTASAVRSYRLSSGIRFAGLIADGSGFAIIPTEIQKSRSANDTDFSRGPRSTLFPHRDLTLFPISRLLISECCARCTSRLSEINRRLRRVLVWQLSDNWRHPASRIIAHRLKMKRLLLSCKKKSFFGMRARRQM